MHVTNQRAIFNYYFATATCDKERNLQPMDSVKRSRFTFEVGFIVLL